MIEFFISPCADQSDGSRSSGGCSTTRASCRSSPDRSPTPCRYSYRTAPSPPANCTRFAAHALASVDQGPNVPKENERLQILGNDFDAWRRGSGRATAAPRSAKASILGGTRLVAIKVEGEISMSADAAAVCMSRGRHACSSFHSQREAGGPTGTPYYHSCHREQHSEPQKTSLLVGHHVRSSKLIVLCVFST